MMTSTPADKVKYLNETKVAIKNAIVAKGVEVAEDATFRSYAASIAAIDTRLPEQEKTLEVTENGSYEVSPDAGYVISKVVATVNVPTGGGGGGEVEPIVFSGNCSYLFNGGNWDWTVELFGNKMSADYVENSSYMFCETELTSIPFDINYRTNSLYHDLSAMFKQANKLESIPKMNNVKPGNTDDMFYFAVQLKELPADFGADFDWTYIDSVTVASNCPRDSMFNGCYKLRSIPMEFLNHGNPKGSASYSIYYFGFNNCYALDEIVGLPNPHINANWTSNAFASSFNNNYRLKNLIFATPDGLPYVVRWKKQTIDLSAKVGYGGGAWGITADKEVKDDATYQALKNDPDWFTTKIEYSRYNHDSAVATINSLPDASAYLATQSSGTNTIKFTGAAGELTDGGAINTLTEEEIAVATAKGWTVTFA